MSAHRSRVRLTSTLFILLSCARSGTDGLRQEAALQDPIEGKVELGAALFFDRRLSRDSSISCASCHVPSRAFAEPRSVSHGIGKDARRRNTQSVLDSRFQSLLDWDGRAGSLEEQALGVFSQSGDMGIDIGTAIARIGNDPVLVAVFKRLYGRVPDAPSTLDALAEFQRTLVSGKSPFDRFYVNGDTAALSESARRGWELFSSVRGGCLGCHVFVVDRDGRFMQFTDYRFRNLGVGYVNGWMTDLGKFIRSRSQRDWGAFRTPSLRNVALTAPYMHDGSLTTLRDVVLFYDQGGIPNPNLDPGVRPLNLSGREQSDLVAFLESLTSDNYSDTIAVRRYWERVERRKLRR